MWAKFNGGAKRAEFRFGTASNFVNYSSLSLTQIVPVYTKVKMRSTSEVLSIIRENSN